LVEWPSRIAPNAPSHQEMGLGTEQQAPQGPRAQNKRLESKSRNWSIQNQQGDFLA